MTRVAIFQYDLGTGGIQKSLVNLLRCVDLGRVQPDLYLSDDSGLSAAALPAGIRVQRLPAVPGFLKYLPFSLARHLYRYDFSAVTEPYDVAIDFNSYQFASAQGALTVPAKRRYQWLHNDVSIKLKEEWKYRVLWTCFKAKFADYDGFAAVSEAIIASFRRESGLQNAPVCTIPNLIDTANIARRKVQDCPVDFSSDDLNLVAVGRLCHQKGYDLMLQALAEILPERPELKLTVCGDGPEREALQQLANALGIEKRVRFLGNVENPFAVLQRADAFISTSRYEGQGMNILEAKAVGLPLLCTKNLEQYCPGFSGYADIRDALRTVEKRPLAPDDLAGYNAQVLEQFYHLVENGIDS